MTRCTVSDNTNGGSAGGGGVRHDNGSATLTTLTNCIIGPNNTAAIGGGIYALNGGTVELIGTTVHGNSALSAFGGGMTVFAIVDYLGRSEYRRRIAELEERRAVLRQRMYEAYAG